MSCIGNRPVPTGVQTGCLIGARSGWGSGGGDFCICKYYISYRSAILYFRILISIFLNFLILYLWGSLDWSKKQMGRTLHWCKRGGRPEQLPISRSGAGEGKKLPTADDCCQIEIERKSLHMIVKIRFRIVLQWSSF